MRDRFRAPGATQVPGVGWPGRTPIGTALGAPVKEATGADRGVTVASAEAPAALGLAAGSQPYQPYTSTTRSTVPDDPS